MKQLRSSLGFTAVEVVIGLALMTMLTLMVVTTQVMVSKQQVEMTMRLDDSIDTNLAERIVFTDLNGIEPSYNNLRLQDGTRDGRGFYDFYPDIPANALSGRITRELTLSLSGTREFFALVNDNMAGPLIIYDPVAAYNVGPASRDFNRSSTLSFVSLNKDNWVSAQRPMFWQPGKVLMLDTPARLRPLNSAGGVDLNVVPRTPIFAGIVQGNNLASSSLLNTLLNHQHPEKNITLRSADEFLRNVPSMGGGPPVVRLRAVRLVRYYLQEYTDARVPGRPARLFRANFEGDKWGEPMMLVDAVESVVFKRESVLKKMIHFKINKIDRRNTSDVASQ